MNKIEQKILQKNLKKYILEDGGNSININLLKSDARALDKELLEFLLLEFEDEFFMSINNIKVFDKEKFLDFISFKNFLSDSYTRFANKIALCDRSGESIAQNTQVVLDFPFKDCILEGGASKDSDKKKEIFFNQTLASDEIDRLFSPKVLDNFSYITQENGSLCVQNDVSKIPAFIQSGDSSIAPPPLGFPNLLLKGNNLLALHSLKSISAIYGNVKLIYIDPPYNTGNDSFNYNDNFNHSSWLTFMKNRLEVAREFLRDDGVIFIQCDDNEQAYLKVLCDEIFGRENFVNSIIWRYRTYQGQVKDFFPRKHDVILWYKKLNRPDFKLSYQKNYKDTVDYQRWKEFYVDDKIIYPNYPKTDSRFDSYLQKYIKENGNPQDGDIIYRVRGYVVDDVWEDIKAIDAKNKTEKTNFRGGQKPEHLIHRIIHSVTDEGDLVMDFFAGSGTTLAVAHKMNRRWIGIEQMDYIDDIKKRIKNVIVGDTGGISEEMNWIGGGNFLYAELMPLNETYKKLIIDANEESISDVILKMQKNAFLDYRVDFARAVADEDFISLSLDDKKKILLQCLDNNLSYVPFSEIKDSEFGISDEMIEANEALYKGRNQ